MYALCSRVLGREIELLQGIAEAQKQVWDAVLKREWAGFEALLAMTGGIGAELERLEGERRDLFRGLPGFSANARDNTPGDASAGKTDTSAGASAGKADETAFYRLISPLPPEERRELAARYRELKTAVLQVKINNENLLAYIAGVRTVMSAFIESAFPDRRGRLYTRRGAAAPQDMRSMVLNRRL